MTFDKDGAATGRVPAIHIAPAVAHHPTLLQINSQFPSGSKEHAWFRLAAVAIGLASARVKAGFDAIEWQKRAHVLMHVLDRFARHQTTSDIGLVGGDDEEKPSITQSLAGFSDARQDFEFAHPRGWIRQVVADDRTVNYTISIQEDRAHRIWEESLDATIGKSALGSAAPQVEPLSGAPN